MRAPFGRYAVALARVVGWGFALCLVVAPIVVQQVTQRLAFEDRVGAVPVELSLCHNGFTVIDTGVLGQVYWSRTGFAGFGAYVRVTGPPEAGGSLSSYVDPKFLRVNAEVVDHPEAVAAAYADEFVDRFWRAFVITELLAMLAGAVIAAVVLRVAQDRPPRSLSSPGTRMIKPVRGVVVGFVVSSAVAYAFFEQWDRNEGVGSTYALPGVQGLSFSSPQTREVAEQVQPFVAKNVDRIRERGATFLRTAGASMRQDLPAAAGRLLPHEGEVVVIAEADPQGAFVGTKLRSDLYALLGERLGEDALAVRTISGDITSNGTVAEGVFVRGEAAASEGLPVVAVKGDHDSLGTVEQLTNNGVDVPDLTVVDVGGLRVAGASDPEFKSLFGGLVSDATGVTEAEIGRQLRRRVDGTDPVIVLLHHPEAARAYLGVDGTDTGPQAGGETVPRDDSIRDVPAGTVSVGHLHDSARPRVLWNTDTDVVTWTVVDQLGTSGGVEERPTLNRFSTPFSAPLKTLSVRLQYVNHESRLQTGYATLTFTPEGRMEVSGRTDVGLPGGQPQPRVNFPLAPSSR